MPAFYDEGFVVREPSWHGLENVIFADYPGREEAYVAAGHDFRVTERPLLIPTTVIDHDQDDEPIWDLTSARRANGFKAIMKEMPGHPSDEKLINVTGESYGIVQNDVPWDIIDTLARQPNVKYETGGVLKDGAQLFVTAYLDEPTTITGDDSPTYPFIYATWTHDGSGAIRLGRTNIRIVCANTAAAAELESARAQRDFTFKHTKNVMLRIEDAKLALDGVREAHQEFVDIAEELARQTITEAQREMFVRGLIESPPQHLISDLVQRHIDTARGEVTAILANGSSIADAHRLTGYGLLCAGVEYLDHLRGYRTTGTYVGRTLLRNEPAKAKLVPLIREVIAA
jgi:phage/plasmid-like protein (TIGR03299 family)